VNNEEEGGEQELRDEAGEQRIAIG
jgi:hypothetical protein